MKKTSLFSIFKPLRAASTLLLNSLYIRGGLYSLVLTSCAMIGSGQLVCGQEQQEKYCYTANNNFSNFLATLSPASLALQQPPGSSYIVQLNVHILEKHDHTGGRSLADVQEALNNLAAAYQPHKIFFHVSCIDYLSTPDDDFYYFGEPDENIPGNPSDFESNDYYNLIDYYASTNEGIDLFIINNPTFIAGGRASGIPGNSVVIGGLYYAPDDPVNTPSIDVIKTNILAHEIGHCLGLFHTFTGTCSNIGFGTCEELVEQLPECTTLDCIGSTSDCNCCTCGDYVCDTYAAIELSPGSFFGNPCTAPVSACLLPAQGPWSDTQGDTYQMQVNNILSYSFATCLTDFTDGQATRMYYHIENSPLLQTCCIDSQITNYNNWFSGTLPLGESIWDKPTVLTGNIIVPNGATLRIQNTNISTPRGVEIFVRKGGLLIIDNATVGPCVDDYWEGIRVLGDGTPYIGSSPAASFATGHYGWVKVVNNSVISNATVAIMNTDDNFSTANVGGIIQTNNATFIDNRYGLFFMPVAKRNNVSSITNTKFSIKNYGPPAVLTSLPYSIGIGAIGTFFKNELFNNTFVNTISVDATDGASITARGTGCYLAGCSAKIRGTLYDGAKEFEGLYKGIDSYAFWGLKDQIQILDNEFDYNHKSVTLTNGLNSTIKNNWFEHIQQGTDINDLLQLPGTAYAIYAQNTWGIDITANYIYCSAPNNTNLQNVGVALINCKNYQNTLNNNSFGGNFGRATAFINNNQQFTADCNAYTPNVNIDWYINGTLEDQGACEPEHPEDARRNSFHTYLPLINSYNIYKQDDGTNFNYVGQVGFNPQYVSPNVTVDFDCPATETESHCTLNPDNCDPDCLLAQIAQTTDNKKLIELYSYLLRKRIDLDQIELAKIDLQNESRNEALKVLIATLESQDSTDLALQKLADLPTESDEDAAFKNLYYELLLGIAPPVGSGKAMPAQEQLLRSTAKPNTPSVQSALAQAIMATYYYQTFDQNVPIVKSTSDNTTKPIYLTISPNPTSNEITVTIKDFSLPAELLITDLYGKTIKRVPITSNNTTINGFGTGIYFCNLVKDNAVISIQKFVVIR